MQSEFFTSEFLEEIKHGDCNSFEKLFKGCCKSLVYFALRFVRDLGIAENLVQDVFVDIWNRRAQLDPKSNFRVYLYKAVKNKALNHLSRQKIENELMLEIDINPNPNFNPHDNLQNNEIMKAIEQALKNLPDKCRIIFSMNRFDGLTYNEIANVLEVSIKTVETQMGRALKYLRQRLVHLLVFIIKGIA